MDQGKPGKPEGADRGRSNPQSPVGGRGVLPGIGSAFWNSLRGLKEGFRTESAIRQEIAIALVALPLSFLVAQDVWTWVALVGSLLFVLAVEFLNAAIERLCDHIQPERHEAIRITKDLASAAVFFSLVLCGIVWLAALWARFAA
jgi:diacylglycerol kinase (ATP)